MTSPATTATTAPTHTCHGAIFCGSPRAVAEAECPACTGAPAVQVCADCGGPTRQAFPTTTAYRSCRRCGHVHPTDES